MSTPLLYIASVIALLAYFVFSITVTWWLARLVLKIMPGEKRNENKQYQTSEVSGNKNKTNKV